MALVNFKKGLRAGLPATYSEGTFYVTTDERAIYLDISNEARIRLGDFQEFATLAALTANTNPNTTALYYVTDINCLAKWNGSEYVQINRDTGATSIEVTGSGNAVTAAVYDATNRKITLTKGATYMTSSDVDSKISAKVGDLGDKETVKAYVDAKTAGIATDAALSELQQALADAETDIDALQADSHTHSNKAELDKIADGDKAKWDAELGAKAAVDAIKNGDSIGSFADVETALAGKQTAGDYATKAEAQGYANAKDAAIAEAKTAGENAQAAADALAAKVGAVPENKTVVDMISEAQAAATYDDTEVRGLITDEASRADAAEKANAAAAAAAQAAAGAAQADVDVLIGTDTNKSVRTIANEELAAQLIAENAQASMDTLEEIAAWIQSHPDDAAAMNASIEALEAIVDGIGGDGEKATVVAYVTDAIAALKIGDYAKAADLTALATRVEAMEGKVSGWDDAASKKHEHANKALLDTYTQTEANLADAVAKKHEHANATVLNGITAEQVELWDGAQTDLAAAKTELEGKISDEETRAKAAEKANSDAIKVISDDYLKAADKTALEGKVSAEKTRAEAAESDLSERVSALESIDHDEYKAYADQSEADAVSTAKSYTDGLLTWGSFGA